MSLASDKCFDTYITKSIMREGGEKYTDDPADRGGKTKWGITEARARAAGYTGLMIDLDFHTAYQIYKLYFWQQNMLDLMCDVWPELASFMLDMAINRGTGTPGKWLQRILNVLNNVGTLYSDLTVDGVCGAMTRASLVSLMAQRGNDGKKVILRAMEAFAATDYITIAEGNPSQERFEFGWLLRAFQNA